MKGWRLAGFALALLLVPAAAFADVSLSTTPPYPGTTINAGTRISFSVIAGGATAPVTYRIVDSFGGGANSSNIDNSGAFFYNTNQSDIGTHTLTITATDAAGVTGSVTQTFTVMSATASLAAATSTVVVGNPVSFTITTEGLFNPSYSAADSFVGSSLRVNAINLDGTFTWTPLWQDIGTHTITVTAKDSSGYSTTSSQTITIVSGLPAAPTSTTTTASTSTPSTPLPATPAATAKTSAYLFTKFLTVGSTGAEVTALQQILITGGYLGSSATGYFGPLTRRAVAAYQSAHGIQPLGYVGPGTRAALNRAN